MADFYVIQDEKTGLFYDGRFGCTTEALRDTLARFVSVENATKDIKANRRRGRDVSDWQIVGINMVIDGVIKPDLGKTKTGWAIECINPGSYHNPVYWRGNKKAPVAEISNFYYGPQSTATASTFETEAAATAVMETLKAQVAKLKKADKRGSRTFEIYRDVKFNVVKVGD